MLNREVIVVDRPPTRALGRLALAGLLAGALIGPMFLLGARVATAPLTQLVVVSPASPAATPPPPAPACTSGVVRTTVARADADAWLADTATLARSARIVPALMDGKPAGFKVYAIRPGSPPATIGLLDGDTLLRVDGVDLTSYDRVLELLARRPAGPHTFAIDLQRRGCPVTLTLTLV